MVLVVLLYGDRKRDVQSGTGLPFAQVWAYRSAWIREAGQSTRSSNVDEGQDIGLQ